MCEICNGSRVVHQLDNSFVSYIPCPNCKAVSEEEWNKQMDYIQWRIKQAEMRFLKEGEQIAV
jgi:hypothetical protein